MGKNIPPEDREKPCCQAHKIIPRWDEYALLEIEGNFRHTEEEFQFFAARCDKSQ